MQLSTSSTPNQYGQAAPYKNHSHVQRISSIASCNHLARQGRTLYHDLAETEIC